MKYKNVVTGAVFDSPFVIKGKNWEPIKEKKPENKATKKETNKPKE